MEKVLEGVFDEPSVGIPEVIGGLILAGFFFELVRKGGLRRFLQTGVAG